MFVALTDWTGREKQHMAGGGTVFLSWSEIEFLGQRPNKENKDPQRDSAVPDAPEGAASDS